MNEPKLPSEALSEPELQRLDELFESINPGEAMVIEELDGFVTALVCSGDAAPASVYLNDVLGLDEGESPRYPNASAAGELSHLLERHWSSVRHCLADGETLAPLLTEDQEDIKPGNLWALGFLRGVDRRPEPWEDLEEDLLNDWLLPIETLAEQIDPEQDSKSLNLSEADRDQLLDEMFDTVFDAYQHFQSNEGLEPVSPIRH